jgi:hypothetical protein
MVDLFEGGTITAAQELVIDPYQLLILARLE